ncbi:hypothetical protein BRADI_2g35461v3 [Brachypodium distachyon]|nr:hypothetical protein BRADI_2g35461v3 [Brachypodium distachyon]
MTKAAAASNSKAATAPNVCSARAAPSTSTRGRGNATTKAAASNSKAAAAPNVSSAPDAPSTSTRGRGNANAANGTGIGRTSAPATSGPNVPARGRGKGKAAMQINESQASSSNANAERGGRRPAHSVDAGNKAFGRSSSGRKTSWFTIGANAGARDAAMKK